jgi:hypothetical protein
MNQWTEISNSDAESYKILLERRGDVLKDDHLCGARTSSEKLSPLNVLVTIKTVVNSMGQVIQRFVEHRLLATILSHLKEFRWQTLAGPQ